MILLCGIPSESPLAMVAQALDAIGAEDPSAEPARGGRLCDGMADR